MHAAQPVLCFSPNSITGKWPPTHSQQFLPGVENVNDDEQPLMLVCQACHTKNSAHLQGSVPHRGIKWTGECASRGFTTLTPGTTCSWLAPGTDAAPKPAVGITGRRIFIISIIVTGIVYIFPVPSHPTARWPIPIGSYLRHPFMQNW